MTKPDPYHKIARALEHAAPGSSDFDLNPDVDLPENRKLRAAGVLVPLLQSGTGLHVILTKRSSALRHHPGQIAFPGGNVDDTDDGVAAAALREAHEEIGLAPSNVEIIGTLPHHETVTGFTVTPVVGRVLAAFDPVPEPGEVQEVFTVPLVHFSDPANFQIQSRHWRGQQRFFYVAPYGPYYVWGATARILRGLSDRLNR